MSLRNIDEHIAGIIAIALLIFALITVISLVIAYFEAIASGNLEGFIEVAIGIIVNQLKYLPWIILASAIIEIFLPKTAQALRGE